MAEFVFWQRIVSPHMANLALELARIGHKVTYVAERPISEARRKMGWDVPELFPAKLVIAPDAQRMRVLAQDMPDHTIHFCQGVRGNGTVGVAQQELARLGRRQWAILETVGDEGYGGVLKRWLYRKVCRRFISQGEGILAIGRNTPGWLENCGVPRSRILPFAYFLAERDLPLQPAPCEGRPFRIAFAGSLLPGKRVGDLFQAASQIGTDLPPWELWVLGDGPDRRSLSRLAEAIVPGRVRWFGMQPMERIPEHLAQADLLVLPSRHDGWGAVISESLMAGTPVVCSDRCGAADVVLASDKGGVYPMGQVSALRTQLERAILAGPPSPEQRSALKEWAAVLGASAGALYLDAIFRADQSGVAWPLAPWLKR